MVLGILGMVLAEKQTVILKLKQPLRAETVKIRLPSTVNAKGERRDLETVLELGSHSSGNETQAKSEASEKLALAFQVKALGKNSLLIRFTLPVAGYVEVQMLDFYGKTLATVAADNYSKGPHILPPLPYRESEQNGVRFLALKIDGKMAMQQMLPQVK